MIYGSLYRDVFRVMMLTFVVIRGGLREGVLLSESARFLRYTFLDCAGPVRLLSNAGQCE